MASISATGSKNHHTFTLEVWENSYSVDNNNSSVHYKLTAGASSFNFNWTSKSVTYTIDIGGNVGSISSGYYPKNSSWVVLEGDCNVGHENDGSKTMGFSFSVSDGINQSYTTGNCSAWGQLTLTTIPRASQPSCVTWPYNTQNVGYLGDIITIHMNRKSSSFTHTVRYGWGDKSGVIGTGVTDNCRWTIPLNFAENIPNTTEGTGAIYVDTYNGASFVGTKSCQFTCYINSSTHKPSVGSVYYIQTNENTKNFFNGDNKVVVQNFSSLSVTFSGCSGFYGSTINEYKVNCSGVIYTSTSPTVTVSEVTNNNSLECQVVDSRGITSNIKTLGFDSYYPYSAPSVSDLYLKRVNDIEDVALFGFKSIFSETAILGDIGNLTIEYRYKKSGEQNYGSYFTISNSRVTQQNFDLTLEDKFDTESNYIFELSLRDYFSQYTTTLLLSTAQPELSIRKDMVGINCVPQKDKLASLQIDGQPLIDFIVEQGTSGIWTYRKWNSGIAECWGTTSEITITGCETWGSIYIADGVITEQTYPFNFIEIPKCTITPKLVSYNFWIYPFKKGTVSNTGKYSIARGSNASNFAIQADLYVIGKWK